MGGGGGGTPGGKDPGGGGGGGGTGPPREGGRGGCGWMGTLEGDEMVVSSAGLHTGECGSELPSMSEGYIGRGSAILYGQSHTLCYSTLVPKRLDSFKCNTSWGWVI